MTNMMIMKRIMVLRVIFSLRIVSLVPTRHLCYTQTKQIEVGIDDTDTREIDIKEENPMARTHFWQTRN